MATRAARRAGTDVSALSTRDRLLLSQAAYSLGEDWTEVARLLQKNALLAQPKTFTVQACQLIHAALLKDADLEAADNEGSGELVKRLCIAHFEHLQALALKDEAIFKKLTAEIDDIKSGKWQKTEDVNAMEIIGDTKDDVEEDEEPPRRSTRNRAPTVTKPTSDRDRRAETTDGNVDVQDASEETESGTTRRGKRKASVLDTDARDKKRVREGSQSANDEDATKARRKVDPESKRFQSIITPVHHRIAQLKDGNIFQAPIRASEAPDYHDIVKRPMDLRTIKNKVKDGLITNSLEYRRDLNLLFANAIMYNRPGSSVYAMSQNMRAETDHVMSDFLNTEAALMHR
ncbi:Bromodomain-containing protein [Cylindrobasidium torrendii FP15055 ss-10]|uniref:Bromodomain-containing protein n=1 Tax=Cylindrobasidium torrendii FP15055 ss-10 TaxID=1314674 RepID=A0A0D7BMT6_9AGAR|nr:Bromodomain-containing protein [Cylindrobasidium torrendii FP15055 ss-10]